jgi:hypothetical protein
MLKSVYRGMSNTDTKDDLYASFIVSLVFRGDQGLPTVFGTGFGRKCNGSKRLSFLLIFFFDWFLKGFVSGIDRFESHLFSSRSFTRAQDHLLQKLMGIEVTVQGGVDIVTPRQNGLSEGRLVPALATRMFTAICGYRLLDIITFLGEKYPPATVVERTPAPTGPLQVRLLKSFLNYDKLIFTLSVFLSSKTGFPFFSSSRLF